MFDNFMERELNNNNDSYKEEDNKFYNPLTKPKTNRYIQYKNIMDR